MADRLGVAPPAVAVARMEMPNALAVGGGRGTIVLDGRLFRLLDGPELEGILAHELAHLESHDGLVQTLAYSLVRTAVGLVALALFPVTLLLRGVSRAAAWVGGEPTGSTGAAETLRLLDEIRTLRARVEELESALEQAEAAHDEKVSTVEVDMRGELVEAGA